MKVAQTLGAITGSTAELSPEQKEILVREKVTAYLVGLGINQKPNGFLFLRDAICIAINEPEVAKRLVGEKGLYAKIARNYQTTEYNVERGIEYSIERLFYEAGDLQMLQQELGMPPQKSKLSNGDFIETVRENVELDMKLAPIKEMMQKSPENLTPEQKEVLVYARVTNYLKSIGITGRKLGIFCLRDAICIAINEPEAGKRLTGENGLYARLAKRHGSTEARTERVIRYSIERAYEIGNFEKLQQDLGSESDSGKLRNEDFIVAVRNIINLDIRGEQARKVAKANPQNLTESQREELVYQEGTSYLRNLGIRQSALGFDYLRDVICERISGYNCPRFFAGENGLYAKIAERHHTTEEKVYRAIEDCIQSLFHEAGNLRTLQQELCMPPQKSRLTNKEFILTVEKKIKAKMKEKKWLPTQAK